MNKDIWEFKVVYGTHGQDNLCIIGTTPIHRYIGLILYTHIDATILIVWSDYLGMEGYHKDIDRR